MTKTKLAKSLLKDGNLRDFKEELKKQIDGITNNFQSSGQSFRIGVLLARQFDRLDGISSVIQLSEDTNYAIETIDRMYFELGQEIWRRCKGED